MSYNPIPSEILSAGADGLLSLFPYWDENTECEREDHDECSHMVWPDRRPVAREVIAGLLDSGYAIIRTTAP